ncbi:MAG: 50S ribosome-binding GTPase, partial [Clostridia bacterium]|nr:50S ribosome-binding GTPase [Clostridia bacterium]
MTKAMRMMEDSLRLVDALIYVVDARAVSACMNPLFSKLMTDKRVLYVFNKCDLVEQSELSRWCEQFKRDGKNFVKAVGVSGDCSQIVAGLKAVMSDKLEKYAKKGASVSVRAMVVGVPNSGKSTIINAMIKRAKA